MTLYDEMKLLKDVAKLSKNLDIVQELEKLEINGDVRNIRVQVDSIRSDINDRLSSRLYITTSAIALLQRV